MRFALLVLFFVVGVVRTCGSFTDVKKPEHALKLFIRFAIAKGVITYGLELMLALFDIVQGTISTIMTSAGFGTPNQTTLPAEMVTTIESCGFFESIPLWAVTLIGGLFITVLSFIMIMTVYGRFFKLYMYTALAPIPLSTFAGEPSQNVGKSFIKSYCAVLLEGAVIVLACIIFSLFASTPPVVNPDAAAVTQVWAYIGELVFNMLEDTKINYPVMQSKDNPNFYLKHGFDKAYTDYGCPYVQENCDMELPSDNIIIYGHHMNDGSMFAGLMKFKDKSFWEKHKTVSFDTLTDRQTYEVIAVFKTVVYTDSPDSFKYYQFVNADTAEDFTAYVEKCKKLSLYETGITAEYGDKLLTLSTCEYSRTNGRLVVVAKLINE